MKKLLTLTSTLFFAFAAFAISAQASDEVKCKQLYQKGTDGIKKDTKCKNDAMNVFKKLQSQLRTCRAHRNNIKNCNRAKRKQARACRGQKRSCKKVCRGGKKQCVNSCRRGKKTCVKACPRGRRGKNCRKSCKRCVRGCRKAKRSCKKVCRGVSRGCLGAARSTARACRNNARSLQAFAVCRNARSLTAKATGRIFSCGWKHYGRAVICSAGSIVRSLQQK